MTKRIAWILLAVAIAAAGAERQMRAEKAVPTGTPAKTVTPAKKSPAVDPAKALASPKAAKKGPSEEKLLLLDDDEESKRPGEAMADNSRCHVCHASMVKEELAVSHARAMIGCPKCHGASDAHIDDESWTWGGKGTPPDKMYLRANVNAFCVTCHDMSKSEVVKCPYPGLREKKVCTDCHGKHRLAQRKCKWK
jgi:hypothetical protein